MKVSCNSVTGAAGELGIFAAIIATDVEFVPYPCVFLAYTLK